MLNNKKLVITGMACRLPDANSLNEFWTILSEGRCVTQKTRTWPDDSESTSGFLNDPDGFDHAFFNISPNEAQCMSPQLKQMMEVSFQAIENSGCSIENLRKLNTGVFCSTLPGDFKNLLAIDPKRATNPYSFSGNAASAMSGRLSYFYDFHGPSITLDTACSSSLSALHFASLSIQNDDCQAALVGAASIFSTSEFHQLANQSKILSVSNQCKTFDKTADGFVASEGCAVILVMPESKAKELGLPIYANIEGLSLNHNGLSNGLMAPSSSQQYSVISDALTKSAIDLNKIAMIETHGTATTLGDEIELTALNKALAKLPSEEQCYLGASKMNIGHTLVCSGLMSLIKVVLSYHKKTIPANPLYSTPTKPELLAHNIIINNKNMPWPNDKNIACVCAYGFTGSNAHLMLSFNEGTLKSDQAIQSALTATPHQFIRLQTQKVEHPEYKPLKSLAISIEILSQIFGFKKSDINPQSSFTELGIDSLTSMDFIQRLEQHGYDAKMDMIWHAKSLRDFSDNLSPIAEKKISENTLKGFSTKKFQGMKWLSSNTGSKPIVLLPPLNCDHKAWHCQLPVLLANDYQVHMPFYPETLDEYNENKLNLSSMSKQIALYINQFDFPADVIGWSLGGILSLLGIVNHGMVISKLCLISSACHFETNIFEKTVEMQKELLENEKLLQISFRTEQSISQYISAQIPLDILKYYYQDLMKLNISKEHLKRITNQCLLIFGDKDPVISQSQINDFHALPHKCIETRPGAGHFIPINNANYFNSLLLNFLNNKASTELVNDAA